MSLTTNQKRDYYKFYNDKNDPSYVYKHNKAVVDEVIKETETARKRKEKAFEEKIRERSDAVATYLKAVAQGKEVNVERYFGKKNLAHLRGEKIVETIKGKMKMLSVKN